MACSYCSKVPTAVDMSPHLCRTPVPTRIWPTLSCHSCAWSTYAVSRCALTGFALSRGSSCTRGLKRRSQLCSLQLVSQRPQSWIMRGPGWPSRQQLTPWHAVMTQPWRPTCRVSRSVVRQWIYLRGRRTTPALGRAGECLTEVLNSTGGARCAHVPLAQVSGAAHTAAWRAFKCRPRSFFACRKQFCSPVGPNLPVSRNSPCLQAKQARKGPTGATRSLINMPQTAQAQVLKADELGGTQCSILAGVMRHGAVWDNGKVTGEGARTIAAGWLLLLDQATPCGPV
jgi:hypothetical protein